MSTKTALMGGGALVVGIVLGMIVAPGGPDEDEIREMIGAETASLSKAGEALGERVGGIDEAMAAIGAKLEEAQGAAAGLVEEAGKATQSEIGELEARIEEMASSFGAAMSEAGEKAAAEREALEARIAALQEELAAAKSDAEARVAEAAATATAAMRPGGGSAPQDGTGVGRTASFGDGAMRVFVSRVTGDAARLSVNGEMLEMAAGETVPVAAGGTDCMLTLDGAGGGLARMSGACGDDLPAPEGVAVGRTQAFEDGSLRVFVSRVDHHAKEARLSINGDLQTVGIGRTAYAGDCGVTLDGVDRGHAQLSAACGDALGVTAGVTPGSAASLGDGKARVFLSSVSEEGVARFSINGQKLHAIEAGGSVDAGDGCEVTVARVADGAASFGWRCGG